MDTWALWMATKEGVTLANLDTTLGFEFARIANGIGSFQILMPPDFDDTLMQPDNRIEIWRVFPGKSNLAFSGLVHGWGWETDANGTTTFFIKGQCINALLGRRILLRGYTT